MTTPQLGVISIFIAATLSVSSCGERVPEAPPPTTASPEQAPPTERVVGPLSAEDSAALAGMVDRINTYVELHQSIEGKLPKLPEAATPEQIDKNQRLFEQQVRDMRASARQGDIFTPGAQVVIKRLLASVFSGPDGKQLRGSIFDENPVAVKLSVNGRYPDEVPISTMPPQVLQTLPELPEDLEYRFVNDNLILLDPHAHVVVDFIDNALPPA